MREESLLLQCHTSHVERLHPAAAVDCRHWKSRGLRDLSRTLPEKSSMATNNGSSTRAPSST